MRQRNFFCLLAGKILQAVRPSELQKLLTPSAHNVNKNRQKNREIAEKVATDSAANSETQLSDAEEISIRSQVGKKRQRM
jgi:hypothetical protein